MPELNEQSRAFGAARSVIREVAAYGAARRGEVGAENVFDFSLGNPSVPAPSAVGEAIEQALALPPAVLHGYTPAAGLAEAREAVADSLTRRFAAEVAYHAGQVGGAGVPVASADDLYLTCGAAASLAIAFHALLNPGDEVMVLTPCFPEYRVFVEAAGGVCVGVPTDPATFQPDAAAIAAAVTPRTRAVVINSPNNPVGTVYTRESLMALAAALAGREAELGHGITIVSDEPYREIAYAGVEVPWVPALWPRTLVCYSYSKALSLPGERIGWVLVPPACPDHDALVAAVAGAGRKLGYVCAPALFQRVIAACERSDVRADVATYERNRDVLASGLAASGYRFIHPDGAFYLWVRAPGGDAEAFCARARETDVLAVPGDAFGCPGWLRVGYCVALETIKRSLPFWQRLAQQ